jgi:plasmid stabilization system protein ParE
MIGYRFLTPAEIEMTEASTFYEAATSGLGAEFLDEVQRVIDLIREHPELGRSIDQGFRQALLHRFPFFLIYLIETDAILIVAVAHQRRRPGYWRNRT